MVEAISLHLTEMRASLCKFSDGVQMITEIQHNAWYKFDERSTSVIQSGHLISNTDYETGDEELMKIKSCKNHFWRLLSLVRPVPEPTNCPLTGPHIIHMQTLSRLPINNTHPFPSPINNYAEIFM